MMLPARSDSLAIRSTTGTTSSSVMEWLCRRLTRPLAKLLSAPNGWFSSCARVGRHLAHGHEAARCLQLLLLHLCHLLGAFAFADVKDGAHPANVFAAGCGEGGLVNQHVYPPAIAMLELHFYPGVLGALADDAQVHSVQLVSVVGRPVRQRG
jgi:hypothetical protein